MQQYLSFLLVMIVVIGTSCSRQTLDILYYKFYTSDGESTGHEWTLGDGTVIMDSTASHTYYLSGIYDVTLKAKKGNKTKEVKKQIYVDAPDICLVKIETPYGVMLAQLYDDTPKHRDNFIKLAEEGYYDGLIFHRVIRNFMIQGGDPESREAPIEKRLGSGGPGYQVDAEINEKYAHVKGALAAARTPDQVNPERRSSGSQFYIVHGKEVSDRELERTEALKGSNYSDDVRSAYHEQGGTPFLDQDYTVFGRILEGLDVIDEIAAVRTAAGDRPLENVWMKITVIK